MLHAAFDRPTHSLFVTDTAGSEHVNGGTSSADSNCIEGLAHETLPDLFHACATHLRVRVRVGSD